MSKGLMLSPIFWVPLACWARTMVISTIKYSKSGSPDIASNIRRHTPFSISMPTKAEYNPDPGTRCSEPLAFGNLHRANDLSDHWRAVMIGLKSVSAAPAPCKICGKPAELYGVVDFHKSCEEARGLRLPLSGLPIYYRRCAACEFLFTDVFDDWNNGQFKAHIYNDQYEAIDPDYRDIRPRSNADFVVRIWGEHKARTSLLDYGGGSDAFCTALRANGFPVAVTYDPMVPEYSHVPERKFELVTCFETLEHTPHPTAAIAQILGCLAEPGLVMYSTFVQPADFDKYGLGWWYVGPRNGHISIFSKQALQIAWGRHGYKTFSLNDNTHFAFRTLPSYGADLIK